MWDVETGKCKYILADHAHAVAVLALDNGLIITGSQDKNINYWDKGIKVTSFKAHEGKLFSVINRYYKTDNINKGSRICYLFK